MQRRGLDHAVAHGHRQYAIEGGSQYRAGSNAVDPYLRCKVLGQQAGHMAQRGLGGAVGAELGLRITRRARGDIDDVAAAGFAHMRHAQLAKVIGRRHVEAHDFFKTLHAQGQRIVGAGAASIVYQVGDAAHLLAGLGDQSAALFAVIDVAAQGQGPTAEAAYFFGYGFNVGQGAGSQNHVGACFSIGQGDAAPDAAPAAGDHRHAAGQVEALNNIHKSPFPF